MIEHYSVQIVNSALKQQQPVSARSCLGVDVKPLSAVIMNTHLSSVVFRARISNPMGVKNQESNIQLLIVYDMRNDN